MVEVSNFFLVRLARDRLGPPASSPFLPEAWLADFGETEDYEFSPRLLGLRIGSAGSFGRLPPPNFGDAEDSSIPSEDFGSGASPALIRSIILGCCTYGDGG